MSCVHPLKGFIVGVTKNGKRELKVTSYAVDHLEFRNSKWIPSCVPYRSKCADKVVTEFVELPCGKCVNCRLDYSRQWANRCMLEMQYHAESYFVTLTYDNVHVPKTFYGDPESGEALEAYTLNKRDFQLFMKRLRFSTGQKLRYFASGEYGSSTYRPHYHVIIFGLHLDDLQVYSKSSLGFTYFHSDFLDSVWSNGKSVVAPVTWETCAYTARYVLKKAYGIGSEFYDLHNLEPEFALMSRRPGIANQYYIDHPEIVKNGFVYVSTDKGGKKIFSPRYFDSLYDLDFPDDMERIRSQRALFASRKMDAILNNTSLSYIDYLEVMETNAFARADNLLRKDI